MIKALKKKIPILAMILTLGNGFALCDSLLDQKPVLDALSDPYTLMYTALFQ